MTTDDLANAATIISGGLGALLFAAMAFAYGFMAPAMACSVVGGALIAIPLWALWMIELDDRRKRKERGK